MKSYFIKSSLLTCVFSTVMFFACNKKALDIPPGFSSEETFFRSENDFQQAVYGIYAKQTDLYWFNNNQIPLHTSFIVPGDDITTPDNFEFEVFGNLQPSSGTLNYLYRTIYRIISRANVVMDHLEAPESSIITTAGLKDNNIGEALFMRGLGHYYLWNLFGTSPLLTERVITTDGFTPAGTTGTQLLDQAIADFEAAAPLLPLTWPEGSRGRATKNSAYGMLGKSLVFRGTATNSAGDFTAAITAFDNLQGLVLVPAFDDNFAADAENNAESLFEFQASQPYAVDLVWLDNDFDNAIGSTSVYWGFFNGNTWFNGANYQGTTKLGSAFEDGDPRKELTLDPATRQIRKYITRDQLTQLGIASANNYRILRFADVLLLKAEAILKSGGSTADAIGLLNQVRGRARAMGTTGVPADLSTGETNTTTIMDWIIRERLLELAAEGQRWFDLRRWHMAGAITLDNTYFSSASPGISFNADRHLYFPIPSEEVDVNPNVPQNPNY